MNYRMLGSEVSGLDQSIDAVGQGIGDGIVSNVETCLKIAAVTVAVVLILIKAKRS